MISWIFYHSINKGNPRLSYILLIYWLLKGTLYSSLFNATLLSYHCIYLGFNTIVLAEKIVMCYAPNLKFGGHFFIESLPAIFLVVGIVIQISTDPCLGHASIQLHR